MGGSKFRLPNNVVFMLPCPVNCPPNPRKKKKPSNPRKVSRLQSNIKHLDADLREAVALWHPWWWRLEMSNGSNAFLLLIRMSDVFTHLFPFFLHSFPPLLWCGMKEMNRRGGGYQFIMELLLRVMKKTWLLPPERTDAKNTCWREREVEREGMRERGSERGSERGR